MSDSNKNRDDKDNKPDPFDFFKLDPGDKRQDTNSGGFKRPKIPFWAVVLIILAVLSMINLLFMSRNDDLIDFSVFRQYIEEGKITRVEIGPTYFTGYGVRRSPAESSPSVYSPSALFRQDPTIEKYRTAGMISQGFLDLLDEKGVTYSYVPRQNNYIFDFILTWILPFGFILLMWRFVFRRMGGGLGGSIFSTGQSKASAVEEGQVTTRFADVAGVDEAKEELVEVVDFLKSPQKYTEIGGKIPKGVLLVGPPGTGKTLLARAVAGEAGVPFFRISGSDFVEMFVGVGASRVRDLFKQAREKAPCIVFIDELDAIGKSRVNSINGNDEREQTLNQLLVEMDGFDNTTGLILLAATNRPDVLDPALLRPGRFDRQVVVDRPDIKGREAILKIHSRNVKLGSDVDLAAIAKTTPGFVGADLANVVNEAALLAVRSGRKVVNMVDFDEAMEKSIMGIQKKSRVIREEERRITAFHEAGHALAAAFTEGAHKVHKITIIPRGFAMGYVLNMPEDDHSHLTAKKILAEVDVCLGGRAAEEIVFKDVSTGASSDLMKATDSIRSMITDYGMSERFKNVVLSKRGGGYGSGEPQLVREYSEETQRYVDEQLAKIMEERYQRVVNLLSSKKVLMDYIANRLLDKEVIEEAEFYEIIEAEGSLETAPLETAPLETATPASSGGPGEVIAPENASDL